MVSDSERAKILEMIEAGTISAEEGLTLLNALSQESLEDEASTTPGMFPILEEAEGLKDEPVEIADQDVSASPPPDGMFFTPEDDVFDNDVSEDRTESVVIDEELPRPPDPEEINKWKRWWMIPLWVGAAITVIGGGLMFWAFRANGFGFWFACAWFPFLIGVSLLALAWSSRTAPWLHVRVQQPPGERPRKIAISFPIPIRLTAWGLRMFGHRIPHMENTNLDEVILALKDVSMDGTPLSVDVSEGEDGERVQVFIG